MVFYECCVLGILIECLVYFIVLVLFIKSGLLGIFM